MTSEAAQQYKRDVSKHFLCSSESRAKLNAILETRVNSFCEEEPEASYDDIVSGIGTSKNFAADLMRKIPPAEIRTAKQRKLFCRFLLIALAVIAIVFAVYKAGQRTQVTLIGTRTVYEDSNLPLDEFEATEEYDQKVEENTYYEEN